jgi:hypothetical protein
MINLKVAFDTFEKGLSCGVHPLRANTSETIEWLKFTLVRTAVQKFATEVAG